MKAVLWSGFRREVDIREHYHPTQKPTTIMAWCMEQAKIPQGATVCDPYMGSGTTAIACIRTGRKFIGVEKDKRHFETACERIRRELAQGVLLPHNDKLTDGSAKNL
jgi:DNA modification methylase